MDVVCYRENDFLSSPFDKENPLGELRELVSRRAGLRELLDGLVKSAQSLFIVSVLVNFHLLPKHKRHARMHVISIALFFSVYEVLIVFGPFCQLCQCSSIGQSCRRRQCSSIWAVVPTTPSSLWVVLPNPPA